MSIVDVLKQWINKRGFSTAGVQTIAEAVARLIEVFEYEEAHPVGGGSTGG